MTPDDPDADRPRPPAPGRGGPNLLLLLAACFAGGAVVWAAVSVAGLLRAPPPATDPTAVERAADPKTAADGEETEAIRLFKAVRDSVVNVDTVVRTRGRFDVEVQETQTGTGSGFVWDDAGRVVTNYHVVRAAASGQGGLRVVLADRTGHDARVVGIAPDQDLAVVQMTDVPTMTLKKIKLGRSADLEVGQKAYAIGNPFGLSLSMTKGIISALDRDITSPSDRTISGVIQTDAPINPGNSGGPLLDKDGRLIGVNTSIASPSGGNVGIGFAIPVDAVNPVVTEIIQRGRVQRTDLGVQLIDPKAVRRAGFPAGVMVQRTAPGGPAALAGLRGITPDGEPGDVILSVDGEPVNTPAELVRQVARRKPGDAVKLKVRRGDETVEVGVTLRGV